MRKLYQAKDRIEAQMLSDFLREQGVEATIVGDYLAGAAGELPANIFPEVWVVDDDLQAAAELLRRWRQGPPDASAGGAWTCPNCGEVLEGQFQVCWRCATPRAAD
jgi:hypothetical protein